MAPLGLGTMITGATYNGAASVIFAEDYMWEIVTGASELRMIPTTYDFHDTWDVDGNDDYMPAAVGAVSDEGYWDLDGNDDVQPLDI